MNTCRIARKLSSDTAVFSRNRDPLPTPTGFDEVYDPDYFGEYHGYPILIVEIKKPGATDDDLQGDQRRLPCMQKLILDRMLSAGVKDPKVVGFLIRREFLLAFYHCGNAFSTDDHGIDLSCPRLSLRDYYHVTRL